MSMLYRRYGKDGMAQRQESINKQIKEWEAEAEAEEQEAARLEGVEWKPKSHNDNEEIEITYSQ